MKSHLSHILPVWKACEILGSEVVHRIVASLLHLRQNTSSNKRKDPEALSAEIETLVKALFYQHPPPDEPENAPLPPTIAQAWKKWLSARALALDKNTLLDFVVPTSIQPHSGPAGHMGLFDCWVYSLQGHAPSSSGTYYGGATSQLVWIPDVLIMLAICKDYRDMQKEAPRQEKEGQVSHQPKEEEEPPKEDKDNDEQTEAASETSKEEPPDAETVRKEKTVLTMGKMAYRIYDSYQKKGTIARDTIHRFLTDVHGEDSYKEPKAQLLLDEIFDDPHHSTGWLHATVSDMQFCKRTLDTMTPQQTHLLLDWISVLGCNMIPPEEIPPSVAAYLDTMQQHPRPLCEMYQLADHRLYEIKRRFHSMVQSSSPVIQGDPMGTTVSEESQPKQSISQTAFCDAVAAVNEEMGHGGYVPPSLAELIFRAGCRGDNQDDRNKLYWGLYHVLQFGCVAVRHNSAKPEDPEVPLLRFLYGMFQLTMEQDEVEEKRILTRPQVAKMLLLMLEYAEFRLYADSPRLDDESDNGVSRYLSGTEETQVDVETAALLGILPSELDPSKGIGNGSKAPDVPLRALVDFTLRSTAHKDSMTFEEFCEWNKSRSKDSPVGRLEPLIMELRLIAAVLLGIPPTLASMEVSIIQEIHRRHKARYPQSSVSRRGPRGTVWYIIDAAWLKSWTVVVNKVSGTPDDSHDGRDVAKSGVRGLPRIDNALLLADNGSLALRTDIRWKHDYEILPPLAWSALQAWYDGGPPVHRAVVKYVASSGPSSPHSRSPRIPTENEIELYPLFVTVYLCDAASRGEARPFQQNYQLSRVTPVGIMLVQLCKELEVDPDLARLWVLDQCPELSPEDPRDDWILQLDQNIVEQRKRRSKSNDRGGDISLLLELKDDEKGEWPRGKDGKEWAFREKTPIEPITSDLGDGVVGLYNMGNTCYLNSSFQCLSHTPIFREYFTSKAYLKDINTNNPLGHQGHLAQVSAVLINSLWKRFNQNPQQHQHKRVTAPGSYVAISAPSLTPKTFKESLGKFNEHFLGNEQHDAQELLMFLLDGLSEDLNRVVDKPYIEQPDSDGRPDGELADIWWTNHLKREFSIIVALFTGQYKSLLTCRTCKYDSARFEPFTMLQLPLPEDDYLTISLVVYPILEGADTMKYCVRVRNDGKLRDVLVALAKLLHADETGDAQPDVPKAVNESFDSDESGSKKDAFAELYRRKAHNLAVVDMRDGYISKIAPNSWSLQDLQNKDTGELPLLHVYELEPVLDGTLDMGSTGRTNDSSKEHNGEENKVESELDTTDDSTDGEKESKPRQAFLAVAQRRSELVSSDHLHPFAHRVFGTPLLLRLNDLKNSTGRDLYDKVAKRLRNVVPKSALRFLTDTSSHTSLVPEHVANSPKQEKPQESERKTSACRTTTDMEEVSAGSVPRYGFRLRVTSRDGRRCLICPWYECCVGCLVPDDGAPTTVMDGDSIVVDWHFAVDVATSGFGLRSGPVDPIERQPTSHRVKIPGVTVKNHSSYTSGGKKGGQAGAITLEECLDAFSQEERIPEAYCSKCKDFRVQTKRMSLWRLPPVVVIQLKRFQFTQHMRRKLRELVVFPVEGLDLSRIMATESEAPKTEAAKDTGAEEVNGEEQDAQTKDSGRSHMLYDLYGVIHHQGALSGGHYVASLKSELDGQWRLFNDAQIYEIHSRDVVDASAYILFYIRRDVVNSNLTDLWDVRKEGSLSEEDMDQLLKGRSDRCTIS